LRPIRHLLVVKPKGSHVWRASDTFTRALPGHVVAVPNPTPDKILSVFPCPEENLSEHLQVVLLAPAKTREDAVRMLSRFKPLQVRTQVVIAWCQHYERMFVNHPELANILSQRSAGEVVAYKTTHGIPDVILDNLVITTSKKDVSQALQDFSAGRDGYAAARYSHPTDCPKDVECNNETVCDGLRALLNGENLSGHIYIEGCAETC